MTKKIIVTEKVAKQTPAGGVMIGKREGQTIIHDDGSLGGYLIGNLHKNNGIKAINKTTGQPLEMQGAEVVITAPAVADQTKREFEGQLLTNRQILSRINSQGGGVSFEDGGDIPGEMVFTGASYNYGGKVLTDHDIAYEIAQCGCALGQAFDSQPFLKFYFHDIADFLRERNNIILSEDLTFRYRGETFSIEPLLSMKKEKDYMIKGADFVIFDYQEEPVGEISFRPKDKGKPFVANSSFFGWTAVRFANGGPLSQKERAAKDPDNYNDVIDIHEEEDFAAGGPILDEPVSTDMRDYKNPYEVNRAIEKLLDTLDDRQPTPDQIAFIANYSGYGGLEKQGTYSEDELKGLLYEYFTPDAVVKIMWGLAYKFGFGNFKAPLVFEPSVGTGNFFRYAPENASLFGNEINRYSKMVCELLYPKARIMLQPFEKNFISKNNSIRNKFHGLLKYDLVIGNPPYGRAVSKYLAMGESDYTKASNFTEYFITRGLDLLNPGGLLIFIVGAEQYNGGTLFLDGGPSAVKSDIFEKAELMDAYRLPTKIFERTGVASEIIVLKKR